MRAHAFQVKLNRPADEFFHFVQRFARMRVPHSFAFFANEWATRASLVSSFRPTHHTERDEWCTQQFGSQPFGGAPLPAVFEKRVATRLAAESLLLIQDREMASARMSQRSISRLFHHKQPVSAITDLHPVIRDNENLIGAAKSVPFSQDGPRSCPKPIFSAL